MNDTTSKAQSLVSRDEVLALIAAERDSCEMCGCHEGIHASDNIEDAVLALPNAKVDDVRGEDARDAARYRWLIDHAKMETVPVKGGDGVWWEPNCNPDGNPKWNTAEKFGAHIDAALAHRGARDE